jgi:hypothetical protein
MAGRSAFATRFFSETVTIAGFRSSLAGASVVSGFGAPFRMSAGPVSGTAFRFHGGPPGTAPKSPTTPPGAPRGAPKHPSQVISGRHLLFPSPGRQNPRQPVPTLPLGLGSA